MTTWHDLVAAGPPERRTWYVAWFAEDGMGASGGCWVSNRPRTEPYRFRCDADLARSHLVRMAEEIVRHAYEGDGG